MSALVAIAVCGLVLGASSADYRNTRQQRVLTVEAEGDDVRLRQIIANLPKGIGELTVARAPEGGHHRIITGRQIRRRLRRAMIDPRGLKIPRRVRVIATQTVLSEPDLTQRVRDDLARQLGDNVDIVRVCVRGGLRVPGRDVGIEVEPPQTVRSGSNVLRIDVLIRGRKWRRLVGSAVLDVRKEPPVVKRGDRIRVVTVVGGVRVSTAATAQESGTVGHEIAVLTQAGQKMLRGRLVSRDALEVVP